MSEPKRYSFKMHEEDDAIYLGAKEQADGMWVKWEDYARLKDEVKRLTLENSQYEEHHKYGQNVITSLREDVERLKEGNECLDQMHEKEMARSAFLCEHVERLKAELSNITGWGRGLESDLSHARVEISFLKAESERLKEDNRQLTNAFEIAEGIIKRMGKAAEAAAKEGKPSV